MAATLKLGDKIWATKEGSLLAYNDENNNFKPLPFDFTRASSATRVNKDGLFEVVTNNKPRIDFLNNSNGALLLEPSRTNLLTYSEDFTNASWVKTDCSVVSNFGASPSGETNASKLTFTTTNTSARAQYNLSGLTAGSTYTQSYYIKSLGTDITLRIGTSASVVGEFVDIIATSEWQRFQLTGTASSTTEFPRVQNITGTSGVEILVWGAQFELGSYATSYIPTQGSAVTVVAETCTDAGNDQVINSTEGVLYAEIENAYQSATTRGWSLVSVLDNGLDLVAIRFNSFQNISFYLRANGVTTINSNIVAPASGFLKIAIKYKSGDNALWINGVEVYTDSISFTFNSPLATLGNDESLGGKGYFNIKDTQVFTTALTDAELIALTTI